MAARRLKLTEKVIVKLPAPDPSGKQRLHWDADLKGFGVLCSGKTSNKSYVVQRDLPGGLTRRVTIAPTNVLKLDAARQQAELLLADMYRGLDPKAGRRGLANATLREVLDDYISARKDLRESSADDYRRAIERHLSSWLDRPMREMTPDDVEDRHREIQRSIAERADTDRKVRGAIRAAKNAIAAVEPETEKLSVADRGLVHGALTKLRSAVNDGDAALIDSRTKSLVSMAIKVGAISSATAMTLADAGPVETGKVEPNGKATANAVMRALRTLWNFQLERVPDLPSNPVRRLRRQWFAVPRRERMVRADDLPKFYAAVEALPNTIARDYLKLLLFTGLRRTEAATLRWGDIDFAQRVIRLPASRTKAGRKLDLPMTDVVRDMLVARRSLGKDGDFVFPSDSKNGHIAEPKFPLTEVAIACGVRVSAHDLRRTFITIAESADISPLALKALVNHSLGNDVTAGYVQMTAERLREPAQRVADRLKILCGIAPREGVAVIR